MIPRRLLGAVGVPGADRFHDLRMLADRLVNAAGIEDRPELKPDDLGVEVRQDAAGRGVAGDAANLGVQHAILARIGREILLVDRLAQAMQDLAEPLAVRRRGARGGLTRDQRFERGADLQDLECFLLADDAHARAAVRLGDDQSFLLQLAKRKLHLSAVDAEPGRQIGLDQPLAGHEMAGLDRLAQLSRRIRFLLLFLRRASRATLRASHAVSYFLDGVHGSVSIPGMRSFPVEAARMISSVRSQSSSLRVLSSGLASEISAAQSCRCAVACAIDGSSPASSTVLATSRISAARLRPCTSDRPI